MALARPAGVEAAIKQRMALVSDPYGADYGKYLTLAEVERLSAPLPASLAAVRAWLDSAEGIDHHVAGTGDWVRASGLVGDVQRLLGVGIAAYQHTVATERIWRTEEAIVLPSVVAAHVVTVAGLSTFPVIHEHPRVASVEAGGPQVTPALIKKLYNISSHKAESDSKASQALAEFQGQGYLPSDLAAFEKKFDLPAQKVRNVTGKDATATAGVEASLDVQYIIAAGTVRRCPRRRRGKWVCMRVCSPEKRIGCPNGLLP